MLIIRRSNCIDTPSGVVFSVSDGPVCTLIWNYYSRCINIHTYTQQPHRTLYLVVYIRLCGPGSSVGIATVLRAGRSGIDFTRGRDFPPVQNGPVAHPASCTMGTGSFPGVKCGRGVLLTTHPLLVPRSCNSRAIPLPTLWATPGL